MKVLAANDSSGEDRLRTCALRLAGVYGPGEERHMPRIVVSLIVIVKGKKVCLYVYKLQCI